MGTRVGYVDDFKEIHCPRPAAFHLVNIDVACCALLPRLEYLRCEIEVVLDLLEHKAAFP
jgi:hypothetical protein